MSKGFPTYSSSAKQGDRGLNIVSRLISDQFGWLFIRNHQEHDFGIDGRLEIVQEDGTVTGQQIAVQIKCGASFLKNTNKWGYIYRGEIKHFNYLANYPIPIIIILCDPRTKECYWESFDPVETRCSGNGWQLTIPRNNKLGASKTKLAALVQPAVDVMKELEEYWRINNLILGSSFVAFVIGRGEVGSLDISRIQRFFEQLHKTKELAHHCQGKIEIMFHGYDDDKRELFEINEVRQYIHRLDLAIHSLFFFLTTGPFSSIRVIAFCLTDISWVGSRSSSQSSQQVWIEFAGLTNFLQRQFNGLNTMVEWLEMSDEENQRISRAAAASFGMEID